MTISKDGLQPIGEFVQHLRSSDRVVSKNTNELVLPPSSVGEMTLRLYSALSYSQNSACDLRRALNGA